MDKIYVFLHFYSILYKFIFTNDYNISYTVTKEFKKRIIYIYYFSKDLSSKTCNTLMYIIFKFLKKKKFILNNNSFFIFIANKRMQLNLKNSYNLKHSLRNIQKHTKKSMYINFLIGFKSMWLSFRNWIFSLFLLTFSLFYLSFLKVSSINILTFKLLVFFGIFYWLLSGFTFFFKKYQYRYFTSSIQRFWKRCYSIFWMLEFFLFFVYFYLTFMASQEPFLMYDNSQIFKTHFFSWKLFFLKIMPTIILILLTYFLTLSIKWTTISKLDNLIFIITFILFYIFWLEFYQFFHIISYYGNYSWKISDNLSFWYLENEFKRTRINNHFISICLVAKFWHIVFTLVFWLFFILRGLEVNRIKHPLLAANFQNFIFIYVLSWLYMFPWVKYTFLKIFNVPYSWFYINTKKQFLFIFFNDLNFIFFQIINDFLTYPITLFNNSIHFYKDFFSDFYYYQSSSSTTSFSQFRKKYIRDYFLKNLNN